jgi:hypothetical protein
MKVKLKYGISAYSGTIDEITFSSHKDGAICIARKWVMPSLGDMHEEMGAIAKNLSKIYAECSDLYKEDLKTYARLHASQRVPRNELPPNSYSLFIKQFYAFRDDNEATVDLKTLSFGDLMSLFPEITSVAEAVEAGYLPKVAGAELLTADM